MAIVALVVVGGGILVGLVLIDRGETNATPSPSLSVAGRSVDPGSPPPSSPAPPTSGPPSSAGPSPDPPSSPPVNPSRLDLGATVTFPNFRITVSQVVADGTQGVLAHAEVCVRKLPPGSSGDTTRVSWDPWRAVTPGQVYRAKLFDGSHPPQDVFPLETRLEVGECASGWIAFADVTDRDDVRRVAYTNSLGNKAGWLVSG